MARDTFIEYTSIHGFVLTNLLLGQSQKETLADPVIKSQQTQADE